MPVYHRDKMIIRTNIKGKRVGIWALGLRIVASLQTSKGWLVKRSHLELNLQYQSKEFPIPAHVCNSW